MAKQSQRFLTYDEQIALLREQGLSIPDEAYAKEILENIGYYELVNGYKALLKQDGASHYRPGATFGDLLALYKFDENLRAVCFKYILRIEIKMRSLLSYAFCESYGVSQYAYLDEDNYDTSRDNRGRVHRMISELKAGVAADRAIYVTYQRNKYGNVPLWVLFKSLSLGTVVRFYAAADNTIRRKTVGAFPGVRCNTLDRMLSVMLDFRNACAHNNILYTCKSDETIPPMPVLRHVTYREPFDFSGNDLFALLLIFRYLLNDTDFTRAKDAVSAVIHHFLSQCDSVSETELLDAMGFPVDWSNL